ncbi:hypothetical protein Tco_1121628 [Tanacetum coccineum]|uniref:Uncharacterized protein n=1 Tax=Tanacetum coccineum TaxID=301880 RepID=A0ABQ5IY86_9ASTR
MNNEKVMPSLPSPEPTVSCFDDLDFFKDFENEFPAIVYNNAQTSKSDLLTEPILNPQHIDKFDLNDETSFSEYDEEEQNILYFNNLFPFNIIHPDDLKSEKDNDDNEIDIIHSLGDCPKFYNPCTILVDFTNMALPPRDQRHQYLRYDGLQYTDADIADFETRLARIYRREVHMVKVFDFRGLPDLMAEGLSARMLMEHRDAQRLGGARHRLIWRQFNLALGLHTTKEMEIVGFNFHGTTPSYTSIRDPILRLCHRLIRCSIVGRIQAPEKVTVTDLFYLRGMDVDLVNIPYLLARYLRLFADGWKSGALISEGQFIARLAEHFRLLTEERL